MKKKLYLDRWYDNITTDGQQKDIHLRENTKTIG